MTDARMPEKWLHDPRLYRLPGEAYKLFVSGLLLSVSRRGDGFVDEEDLRDLPYLETHFAAKLESAGLWERTDGGWWIADFTATQTASHELQVLENARKRQREKKARQREARNTTPQPEKFTGVSGPGTEQARTGQARPGEEVLREAPTLCPLCNEPLPTSALGAPLSWHPGCEVNSRDEGWPGTTPIPA